MADLKWKEAIEKVLNEEKKGFSKIFVVNFKSNT